MRTRAPMVIPFFLLACEKSGDRLESACSLPVCEPCACDETTACDEGCADCDPECGRCRPPELSCERGASPSQPPAGSGSDAGASDGAARPPAGALGLEAHEGRLSDRVGFTASSDGRLFAIVALTLSNRTGLPVPLAPPLFSIQTARGLTYLGHALTTELAVGCPADALLETENSANCAIVFEIGEADEAASVRYSPPDGTSVTAPLSLTPCTRCGRECVDLRSDLDHCGVCDRPAPSNGSCIDGHFDCNNPGLTACPTELWDGLNVSGPGWIDFPVDYACVDTAVEPFECGGCGRQYECWNDSTVVARAECRASRPVCARGALRSVIHVTMERRTCRDLCGDVGGVPMRSDLGAIFWFYRTDEGCIDWTQGAEDQLPTETTAGLRCPSAGSFLAAACRCSLP